MIGAAGFAVLVVILHLLPSTYNPLSHYVSDYAHDSYGYLMQMAFALLGVGVLSGGSVLLGHSSKRTPSSGHDTLDRVWPLSLDRCPVFG